MLSRRQFMTASTALLASGILPRRLEASPELAEVNDVHSQLNPTRVLEVLQPQSMEEVRDIIRAARKDRKVIAICGGRHAMGGQQFGTDTVLIDVRKLNRIIKL